MENLIFLTVKFQIISKAKYIFLPINAIRSQSSQCDICSCTENQKKTYAML